MFEFIYRKKIRSHRFVVSLKFSGWVMLDRGNVECLIFFFFFLRVTQHRSYLELHNRILHCYKSCCINYVNFVSRYLLSGLPVYGHGLWEFYTKLCFVFITWIENLRLSLLVLSQEIDSTDYLHVIIKLYWNFTMYRCSFTFFFFFVDSFEK